MKKDFDRYTCTGCGFCCMKAPCAASVRLYPGSKICPQLIWSKVDNRYNCGLMLLPGLVGESYRKELYAGEGCCSNLNSWRFDVKNRDQEIKQLMSIDRTFQVFLKCLGEQFLSSDVIAMTLMKFEKLLTEDYSKQEAKMISQLVDSYIKSNRPSYLDGFM